MFEDMDVCVPDEGLLEMTLQFRESALHPGFTPERHTVWIMERHAQLMKLLDEVRDQVPGIVSRRSRP